MVKNSLLAIFLFLMCIHGVLALTAESESYSVNRFGTGVQATNLNSTNLTGQAILLANVGTPNATTDELDVNNGFWDNSLDNVSLRIDSYSISPKSTSIGSIVGLYISASNFQNVWAKIISPNNQEQILSLINNQFVYYLPTPSVLGNYTIIFYANGSSGAIVSMIDHFYLTEQASSPSSGGGGGSTVVIEKTCNNDWDCTPLSLCSGGKQVRNCTNIGTCIGTSSKPLEEVSCSNALFDVFFKPQDSGLIQNDTLKFDINLVDKMNAEKVDVYIKYTILDSNNTEVFRQIETRAVQGNLTYKKEISEIRLSAGEYVLRVDVLYGNLQRAFTEYKFIVDDRGMVVTAEMEQPMSTARTSIMPMINGYVLLEILILSVLALLILLLFSLKRSSVPSPYEPAKHSEDDTKAHLEGGSGIGQMTIIKKVNDTLLEHETVDVPNPSAVSKYVLSQYVINDSSKYFYVIDGQVFRSLSDLMNGLELMDETTFIHHVRGSQNDFSSWIIGVFGDVNLSDSIKSLTTKEQLSYFLKNNTC